MKRILTAQKPIQAANDAIDEKLAAALSELEDDFDYAIAGIEKLGRSGANQSNDAMMICEDLQSAVQQIIDSIADKL